MPKLKEILEEDGRKLREAVEANRRKEEAKRQREIENIALFAGNLQPFLAYLAERPEIFTVIEDLQALIKYRKDIPKVERLVIFDKKIQLPLYAYKDKWFFVWTLVGQEQWEEDKVDNGWWKDLSKPRKWAPRLDFLTEGGSIQATGLRVNYGHYDGEYGETEGWSQFVDVILQKGSSGQDYKLVARRGQLNSGLRIGTVVQEIKVENPANLDETVADIYLKSLQPQKGKV